MKVIVAMLLAFAATCAGAQDASAVLRRASAAIGADDIKTLRYAGSGVGYSRSARRSSPAARGPRSTTRATPVPSTTRTAL